MAKQVRCSTPIPLAATKGSRVINTLVPFYYDPEEDAVYHDAWKYRQLMKEGDVQSDLERARFYLDRAMKRSS